MPRWPRRIRRPDRGRSFVGLLLSHPFQRSAKLGRTIREDRARGIKILAERVLVLRDTRHVLLDDVLGRVPDEPIEAEDEDGEVVELADHRDEVGDDVDRERQIRGHRAEHRLLPDRHARIARETPDQTRVRRHLADGAHRLADAARTTDTSSSHRGPPPAGNVPAARRAPPTPPRRGPPPRTTPDSAPFRPTLSAARRPASDPPRPPPRRPAPSGSRRRRSASPHRRR